jgi:hypothetical protein
MKPHRLLPTLVLATGLISGCDKPAHVTTIKSPLDGVFYTLETYDIPYAPPYTTVYAHLERHGKATRIIVLDGDNLSVSNIIWDTPHSATLCLDRGTTTTFHNAVKLTLSKAPGDAEILYTHLNEHCAATLTHPGA